LISHVACPLGKLKLRTGQAALEVPILQLQSIRGTS